MRKYITLFFSVCVILSACKADKSSADIIKPDEMISVLTDMHIVDGTMYNAVSQNLDTLYKYGNNRYLAVFKKYHVDSVQFRHSLKYYTTQPLVLQGMYDKILANLQQKTDSINKKMLKNNVQRPQ
jgi:hypothetical protein